MTEFRLLGDVEVRLDDCSLDIGHARQRCVLAALLVDANRVVPVEVLVDRVWAGRPPQRVRGALHNYISRLRQALNLIVDVQIRRNSGGYVIVVEAMDVDLHRFLNLVEQARSSHNDVHSLELAEEALSLWRGDAFASLDTPWLASVRDDLDRRRRAAELDRNDMALRLGHHARLLSDFSSAVAAHPFDERLTGQLMVALYRIGRQGDALAEYEAMRLRLADDFGADPGPALQRLHLRILQADPELSGSEMPSEGSVPLRTAGMSVTHRPSTSPNRPPATNSNRFSVSWPHRVGIVPALADWFRSRTASNDLARAVADRETAMRTQVLSGLGGVGKTQVAAAYAEQLWKERAVDLLIWVTATSRSAIVASYAQAAGEVLGTDVYAELAAGRLLSWLAKTDHRWLIVLDDLRIPADLTGLWPPITNNGQALITTRRRDAALLGTDQHLIEVGVFTTAESVDYLSHKLGGECPDDAARLAADLGYLPLALAQAAAYMLDRDLTFEAYRQRLTSRRRRLRDLFPEHDSLPDQHTATVAATWSLSAEAADRLHPLGLAQPLLNLASMLDPNGVPTNVFTTPAVLGSLEERDPSRTTVNSDDARDALHNLHRLNLATIDPIAGTLRVHALIQRATRDQMSPPELTAAIAVCADALTDAWPEIEGKTANAHALRANATTLTQHAGDQLWTKHLHPLLIRAGKSLGDAGLLGPAISFWQDLYHHTERALGAEHPDTLTTRQNIARWLGESGDTGSAATVSEQLLRDRLRVLGPDHPDTLTTRHQLARWQGESGNPLSAAEAYEALLTDQIRVLGSAHPHTLCSRHQRAQWRGKAGDATGAYDALTDLLVDHTRILGPNHPHTLDTRFQLALWQGELGNAAGAAKALLELFTDRLRFLGPDHPHTLETRHELACWRGKAGHAASAAEELALVLDDRLRTLGADHPDTLKTRFQLARWRGETGDASGAAEALAHLVTDLLRTLGPYHPDTLTARHHLIRWQGEAGDANGAVEAAAQLLTDRLRVLGPDHPDSLRTRHSHARWLGKAGDAPSAVQGLTHVLADQLRVLGPDHPDTLYTRHHRARWQGQAGDAHGAMKAFTQLLADRKRILGHDHPDTLNTRHHQARWQGEAGDAAGAATALTELLADQVRVLGREHVHTLNTRSSLDNWLDHMGAVPGKSPVSGDIEKT